MGEESTALEINYEEGVGFLMGGTERLQKEVDIVFAVVGCVQWQRQGERRWRARYW